MADCAATHIREEPVPGTNDWVVRDDRGILAPFRGPTALWDALHFVQEYRRKIVDGEV